MSRPALCSCILLVLLFASRPVRGQEMACSDCHPDKSENTVVHPAVAMGCDSCHAGTHRGEQPAPKLTMAVPDLCFTCHDQSAFQKRVQHYPAASGMCLFCHTPHAGPHERLLEADSNRLCTSCHKKQADGGHVLRGFGIRDRHPLQVWPDPSRPDRTLSCVSCHHPHASDSDRLLQGSGTSRDDICLLCHRKVAVVP